MVPALWVRPGQGYLDTVVGTSYCTVEAVLIEHWPLCRVNGRILLVNPKCPKSCLGPVLLKAQKWLEFDTVTAAVSRENRMTNSIRADIVHLVRGMVGIRVYVHNVILLYPDYTPFTRRVLGSIGTENLVKAQQHTALPQQRCLSRPCASVCRRTAGRAGRRGLQRPFALPIPSSEARRLPDILAVGGMIQQLRKEARACVACSSLACWPSRWGSRVHLHSLRE